MSRKLLICSYLQGALHDGTYSKIHKTHRISQANTFWLKRLQKFLTEIGHRSWIYKEGKNRQVWILETSAKFLDIDFNPWSLKTRMEKIFYIRGYFDAEGGLPRKLGARFYIQLCQNNLVDLRRVRKMLQELGIKCGRIHNPSRNVDPDYFRFFILAESFETFAKIVGSWHPRKRKIFDLRVKI